MSYQKNQMNKLEKDYYPIVEKFLKKQHNCFKTEVNSGLKYSRADVIGVSDIGGDLTGEIETVIVEVKRGMEAFATASGQTFGYTVYANRVYLADIRETEFTSLEIQIANHLGIGLIKIDKKDKCSISLSSPFYNPLKRLGFELLEKLKIGKCQFCETYIEIGDEKRYNKISKDAKKSVVEEKGLVFWNWELGERKEKMGQNYRKENTTYDRRFLCKDCVRTISQIKS